MAVSDVILSIKGKASSPAQALKLTNAVAAAFLKVRGQVLQTSTDVTISGIRQQMQNLTTEINSSSASNETKANDQVQVSQLGSQITQAQVGFNKTQASRVLDQAAPVRVSAKKVTLTDMLSGLVAGLGLGLGFVVLSEALSDRLRRREDIAAALGAPVELSVRRYRRARLFHRARLRRRLKRPNQALQMVERRLAAHLTSAPGKALATISIEATEPTALAVARLARRLASEGSRVTVLDMGEDRPLASLFGVRPRTSTGEPIAIDGGALTLLTSPADPTQLRDQAASTHADAVLVLASLDPAFGAEPIATWAREAVLIITAGAANLGRIRGAGQLLRHDGMTIKSAILVGADRQDDSPGIANPDPVLGHTKLPIEAYPAQPW
jgi:capsular polysaccharide biosynthesis protein